MKLENKDDDESLKLKPFSLPRRSSSEPQEFFEFLHPAGEYHSSAEDIILHGKLIPYRPPENPIPTLRRRSESLSAISLASDKPVVIMRASKSLDYQKLRRVNAGDKAKTPARVRWPAMLMFGAVKVPAEMELCDIKSRQARRRKSSAAVGSGDSGGGSWRLLKALSCKDHASVAVMTANKSLRI